MKKLFFFLGKGGVGKTTLAGSFATYLSKSDSKVYLASIDPAHNLFDFFGIPGGSHHIKISDNLFAEEVDLDLCLKNFLKESTLKMKKNYSYLQMINLENMFDLLKHSPGMEEYALLSALNEIVNIWKSQVDFIVIDTPPTGLMLKIFFLPKTTLLWIEKLKKLRKKILDRRSQLIHIKGKHEFGENFVCNEEEDVVFKELGFEEKRSKELLQLFSNSRICKKILVVNYDELSIREGAKIINDLASIDISVDLIVCNKKGITDSVVQKKEVEKMLDKFKSLKRLEIPFYRDCITPRNKMMEIAEVFANELI